MTNDPAAIIFDLDGVLADTVDYHYESWKQIADLLTIPFDRADMNQLRGRQRRDCLLALLAGREIDKAQFEHLLILKDEIYLAYVESMTAHNLLPGVLPLILAAREYGLKMGVASASQSARLVLEKTELLQYMDVIGDGATVCRSKPAPDIFIWVAGALRVHPAKVIVFEDSRAGVEAARTAGMFVVGVGGRDLTGQAHIVVLSMAYILFRELIAQFQAYSRDTA